MAKGRKTGGRQKGTPNKVTRKTRELLALLVDENLPLANEWLKSAWKDKPSEAAAFFKSVIEFAAPRFARVDPMAEAAAYQSGKHGTTNDYTDAELAVIVSDPVAAMDYYTSLMRGDPKAERALERMPEISQHVQKTDRREAVALVGEHPAGGLFA